MSLQFIIGGSGSGKTHTLQERLIQESLQDPEKTIVLIVPEQFTLQTQQELIQAHPRKGLLSIEVLSFQRLAYRLGDALEIGNKILLKDTGKSMVIRKILEVSKHQYPMLYKNIHKKGFVNELKAFITEAYQYDITSDTFDKIINETTSPLLKDKVKDLKTLLSEYKSFLEKNFFTAESTMDLMVDAIGNTGWLKEADVYIDGFYGFTPIQYKIMEQLLKQVKKVHVAVTMDSHLVHEDLDDSHLFYESQKMIRQLKAIAESSKIPCKEEVLLNDVRPFRYVKNDALSHLQQHLYRYPVEVYQEHAKGLYFSMSSHVRKECQYVADSIMKLVMEKGYRYQDISIVAGDFEGYGDLLKQVLGQYDIPYFMDIKKQVITHPMVALVLSALEILHRDFAYDSIFKYLKTGLLDVDLNTRDLLENYVLAYGIRGASKWQNPWTKPYPYLYEENQADTSKALLERINSAREEILAPLLGLKESLISKEQSVEGMIRALIGFMEKLGLEEKLFHMQESFKKSGHLSYQREYAMIYKQVMEVFQQMMDILGTQTMTIKELLTLLQAGFEADEMGLVPPGLDQVVIGDMERTRMHECRALFVVGFNEGKVPKVMDQAGLITDSERIALKEMGIKMAPDQKTSTFRSQMNVYMGLIRVRELLYISYAKSGLDGKALRPSILLSSIKRMYPNLKILDLDEIYSHKIIVNRPLPTFYQLLEHMKNPQETDWKEVYQWYYQNTDWKERLEKAKDILFAKPNEPTLDITMTKNLYGTHLMNSVSRLETFSKCPFMHFVDYGLKLKERMDYSVKMPDIGILFHKAIDRCSRMIEKQMLDWKQLDKVTRDHIAQVSVEQVVLEEQRGIFTSTHRNQYLVKRLTRITKRALDAISYQISKGEFKPIAFEQDFSSASKEALQSLTFDFDQGRSMKLTGRIDRMDAYEEQDILYLTIVDYKSGKQSFDLMAVYYGLQLQLFVYLNAATELMKENGYTRVVPAGIFYFHIDDPILQELPTRDYSKIQEEIMKTLRLKGLVLDQEEIIRKLDARIEKTSDVIPVSLTSDGTVAKTSSVATQDVFENLQSYVEESIHRLGKDMIAGNIRPMPYKRGNETACDYCGYASICRFEKGLNGAYRYLSPLTKEEVIEKVNSSRTEE